MDRAVVYDGYEFHIVNGKLFITSEENPDIQIALSIEAARALVKYISAEDADEDEEQTGNG